MRDLQTSYKTQTFYTSLSCSLVIFSLVVHSVFPTLNIYHLLCTRGSTTSKWGKITRQRYRHVPPTQTPLGWAQILRYCAVWSYSQGNRRNGCVLNIPLEHLDHCKSHRELYQVIFCVDSWCRGKEKLQCAWIIVESRKLLETSFCKRPGWAALFDINGPPCLNTSLYSLL